MAVYEGLQMSQALNGADNDRKIKSYLFQNNELLRYMFNNLDPEDNYSDQALRKYYENNEKIVSMELSVEGLNMGLKNLKTETETSLKAMDGLIQLKVSKGDVSNQISVEKDKVYIGGNRLVVDSANFKLDEKGNAKFSGTVTGSKISGSVFSSDVFYADEEEVRIGDFEVSTDASYEFRSADGEIRFYTADSPGGQTAGLKVGLAEIYGGHFWGSGITVDYVDANSSEKNNSYFYDIYLGKSWWDDWSITETVRDLWEQVDDLSDARVKENIIDIEEEEVSEFLLAMRPVVFQYRRDGKISAGFIAQEVDAAMDETGTYYPVTGTDELTGYFKVNYKAYIPLLVKAYQQLYTQVQRLDTENNSTYIEEEK